MYSLKKINRVDYSLDFYKKLLFSKKSESLEKRITNISLKINGLENAIQKAGNDEKSKLETAKRKYLEQLPLLKSRLELSKKGFIQRVAISTRLLISGSYSSGLKSYLRDILGQP